jgi:bacterioferritin (cytochrome b1)
MELMGSWAHTMVDPEIKIGFGRQMFQDSVHADLLGKRIPELKGRSQHFHSIPPSDEFVRLLEKIWRTDDELLRMVGLYRVVKPALVRAYRRHLKQLELPADEPTAYILRHIADEEQDHVDWAEKVIGQLAAGLSREGELREWQKVLQTDLEQAGGILGEGKKPGTYTFTKSHAYSRLPVRDPRWRITEKANEFTEKNWSFDTMEGKLHLLHDLLNSEFITVERMGRILSDFPEIPWQMKMDMARQAWDEARHAEIVQRRLEELGGHVGMFPTSCFGWEQDVNRPDPLERLALSNMTFESESCKHLRDWILKAKNTGDFRSQQLVEFLLADEVNHVLYGIHWIDELTRNDPERRKRVLAYPDQVLAAQHPVGVYFGETVNAPKQ